MSLTDSLPSLDLAIMIKQLLDKFFPLLIYTLSTKFERIRTWILSEAFAIDIDGTLTENGGNGYLNALAS